MEEEFSEYFYTNGNNQVVGPYSPDQILQLREQGVIFDDTLVCKNGDTTWKPLERFLDTLVNEIRNQKAKVKAKALIADTTLSSFENNDEEDDDTETESTEGRTSFDIYKIVHLALLAIIAILLACQLFSKYEEYEYGAVYIDRDDMFIAKKVDEQVPKYGHLEPIRLPSRLNIGENSDWTYVGILCNDGINGSWILVRRKKAHK